MAILDEIISRDPQHAEALLKKGTALERLQKLEQALEYYDRAIAANRSLTLAYLYKGGVCNQLERYNEALQCYEQALRSQQRARAT
jgi:tetratricopeptide (TPR) repeat protein